MAGALSYMFVRILRFADHQKGFHALIVVPGEPVLGAELIAGIAHDFIEAGAVQ